MIALWRSFQTEAPKAKYGRKNELISGNTHCSLEDIYKYLSNDCSFIATFLHFCIRKEKMEQFHWWWLTTVNSTLQFSLSIVLKDIPCMKLLLRVIFLFFFVKPPWMLIAQKSLTVVEILSSWEFWTFKPINLYKLIKTWKSLGSYLSIFWSKLMIN